MDFDFSVRCILTWFCFQSFLGWGYIYFQLDFVEAQLFFPSTLGVHIFHLSIEVEGGRVQTSNKFHAKFLHPLYSVNNEQPLTPQNQNIEIFTTPSLQNTCSRYYLGWYCYHLTSNDLIYHHDFSILFSSNAREWLCAGHYWVMFMA